MFYTNIIFILSFTVLIVSSNPLGESNEPKPTTSVYNLICSNDKPDCDLVEVVPNQFDVESSQIEDSVENSKLKRSNLFKLKLHNFHKRFFPSRSESFKVHKSKDINCISQDCKWFMTKDKRGKNGVGALTCLGDPYSNSGSRCVPIEGLYIG